MELGTGIFLSALFLGTIFLYVFTKDRWNWKKIILWNLGVLFGLSLIGIGAIYFYDKKSSEPVKGSELWEISLNDSIGDVKFKKGEPYSKPDPEIWVYKPYETLEGEYVIYFRENRVRAVIYKGPSYNAPHIKGVSFYDSVEDLEKKLGKPSFTSTSNDELRRLFSYPNFNMAAQFESGQINALGIYNPEMGPLRFRDELKGIESTQQK